MKKLFGIFGMMLLSSNAHADTFAFAFDWENVKLCTSGRPNTVPNPLFKIVGMPDGTTYIRFKMKDLDAPAYNHGGGWVKMDSDGTVAPESFRYKSPCPPDGQHTYEWTAIAKSKKGFGGKTLGVATATRVYPK